MRFYSKIGVLIILNMLGTGYAQDGFIDKEDFSSDNYKPVIRLGFCVKGSTNSMIFKRHNSSFIKEKYFAGNTECNEEYITSQEFIEGKYVNIQELMKQSVAYFGLSKNTNCSEPYQYTFYMTEGCIDSGVDYGFDVIHIENNSLVFNSFSMENVNELCQTKGKEGVVRIYENDECVFLSGNGAYNTVHVNKKDSTVCENTSDPVAVLLVFVFIALVLF